VRSLRWPSHPGARPYDCSVGRLLQGELLRRLHAALQHLILGGQVLEPAGLGEAPRRRIKNGWNPVSDDLEAQR
jgi:hypothetical protein